VLVDTGGLYGDEGALSEAMARQAELALDEADLALFLVDARAGLTASDEDIAQRLRRRGLATVLVINKVDGVDVHTLGDFASLGFAGQVPVSASHGRGMAELEDALAAALPGAAEDDTASAEEGIRVAVIGRPNVGKSTLINRLLGEERQLVFDAPGTTRDAIAIPFEKNGRRFVLMDTAGVRRKGRVEGVAEKFSVVKTLDAMARAQVVLLVLDAREGVVEQDLHLLGQAVDSGAGVLIALNKWDGLAADDRERVRRELDRRLRFAPWIAVAPISALHGSGVGLLLDEVVRIYRIGAFDVSTSRLTRILTGLTAAHPPPAVRGRAIKLRFAHKAGDHPPRIVIHGNQTRSLPASYVRYLENGFREALDLEGNPVHIELRTGDNPYAGKRNELTPRQQARRQRMIRHHKRRGR